VRQEEFRRIRTASQIRGVSDGTIPAICAFYGHRKRTILNPSEVLICSVGLGKKPSAGAVPPGGSRGPFGRTGCSNGRVSRPRVRSGGTRQPGRSSARSDNSSEGGQPLANPRKGGPYRGPYLGSGKRDGRRRFRGRGKFSRRWEGGTKRECGSLL
jgi:hypothetical protein